MILRRELDKRYVPSELISPKRCTKLGMIKIPLKWLNTC
jgi:hypothetical protein